MAALTITETLAEIKTVGKRIEKKREFVGGYLARQEGVKDPLEKDGGSGAVIERERQAIADLEQRLIDLRRGIQMANDATPVTINGTTRYISEWLTWRRDIAPNQRTWLAAVRTALNNMRDKAKRDGHAVVSASVTTAEVKPTDLVVNIDEYALGKEIETIEDTLGQLDGQLSLKNATIMVQLEP